MKGCHWIPPHVQYSFHRAAVSERVWQSEVQVTPADRLLLLRSGAGGNLLRISPGKHHAKTVAALSGRFVNSKCCIMSHSSRCSTHCSDIFEVKCRWLFAVTDGLDNYWVCPENQLRHNVGTYLSNYRGRYVSEIPVTSRKEKWDNIQCNFLCSYIINMQVRFTTNGNSWYNIILQKYHRYSNVQEQVCICLLQLFS